MNNMYNKYHSIFESERYGLIQQRYREALYAGRNLKKADLLDIKINFNDIVMRELGLDYDEDTYHVYNIETESLYQVSEKFIKYVDTEYPIIHANEIELNLIENPRLMEILFGIWISSWQERKGIEVNSYAQVPIRGSKQGYFIMTYAKNGKTEEIKSDTFINESLRIFNLITKLRHTSHMYDVSKFNIEISPRKDKK